MFTPIIPPTIPAKIPAPIIINELIVKLKSITIALEIMYNTSIYINPTIAPFNIPFCFIFLEHKKLPANILIATMTIIVGKIVLSDTFVYAKIVANIAKKIIYIIIESKLPFIILNIFSFNLFSSWTIFFSSFFTFLFK